MWLDSDALGPEWQPSRCKFIMHRVEGKLGTWINVDAAHPLAWKQAPFYGQIKAWSEVARHGSGYVAVCVADRTFVVFPEEDLEIPDVPKHADLKVGYRHSNGQRRPLVMVRSPVGVITEHLGTPIF